jgi:predicted DNA binding CopG/RHH family protein
MSEKNQRIFIRVSAEEHKQIKAKADALGLKISAYIRMMALNGSIKREV